MMQRVRRFVILTAVLLLSVTAAYAGWQQTNGPYAPYVYAMVTSGTDVVAATYKGIFRSDDQGSSWTWVSVGTTAPNDIIRCLVADGATLWAGTKYSGVLRSTDNGATWMPTGLSSVYVYEMIVVGSSVYAGTTTGLFRSDNAGATWSAMNSGITDIRIRCLIQKDAYLFVGTLNEGVFRSADGGLSWTPMNGGLGNLYMTAFTICGDYLFASTWNDCVYRSNDYGASWTKCSGGLLTWRQLISFAIDGTSIYGGSVLGGVYLTTNNGDNWTPMRTGLTDWYISSIVRIGSRLIAGTECGGICISDDGGATWSASNNGLSYGSPVSEIRALAAIGDGGIMAATANGAIFTTDDGGASWQTKTAVGGISCKTVTSFAVRGSSLYAGTNCLYVYRSTDRGMNWEPVRTGFVGDLSYDVDCMADGDMLLAGTGNGVFRLNEDGVSWRGIGLLQDHILALTTSGLDILAGSSFGHVFLSPDSGAHWEAINTGLPLSDIAALAFRGSDFVAATADSGVFISHDRGANWLPLGSGLPRVGVRTLSVYGSYVLAGTMNRGVWRVAGDRAPWVSLGNEIEPGYIMALLLADSSLYAARWSTGVWKIPQNQMVCCQGTVGDIEGSDMVDLGDLTALVNYLTGGGYVLSCPEEANISGSGIVDVTDLTSLVSYLTGGGYELPNCP